MTSRIGQLFSRLGRVDPTDRTGALTFLSLSLAVILVAVIVVVPRGDDAEDAGNTSVAGTATERARELAEEGLPAGPGAGPLSGAQPGSRSEARVDASEEAAKALPPITDKEIKVGITYVEDPGTAAAAAGFGAIGQLDQRRGWEALIRQFNQNPPFGRKVIPVWYSQTEEEIQSKGGERIEQEACAHFTQDNKVFMVWDGSLIGSSDTFARCATKARVPEVGSALGLSYSKTYKDFPYMVDPAGAALDRMAEFHVDQLVKQGFFRKFKDNTAPYVPQKPADGKARIGLIRYDQPSYKAAAVAMKKRLAAHGLSLCSGCEFEVAYSSDNVAEQLNDAGEVNTAIQNCKGRQEGPSGSRRNAPCTHMLFLGSTAGVRITLFFVDGAEKQQYRPRLGFTPLDAPTAVRDFLGESSYPQFRQSVLITDGPDEFDVRTDAFKRCKKVFEDAGEVFSGEEAANKEDQIAGYCNTAWYFEAALRTAGRKLSVDSWLNGVANVPAVPSAGVYLMKTTAHRHDGSGAIRVGEWFDNCHCFKPTSDVIPV